MLRNTLLSTRPRKKAQSASNTASLRVKPCAVREVADSFRSRRQAVWQSVVRVASSTEEGHGGPKYAPPGEFRRRSQAKELSESSGSTSSSRPTGTLYGGRRERRVFLKASGAAFCRFEGGVYPNAECFAVFAALSLFLGI